MSAHSCTIPLQAEMVGVYRCSCRALWAQEEMTGVWRRVPMTRITVIAALVLVAGGIVIGKVALWRFDFDGLSTLVLLLLAATVAVAVAPAEVRA